ncbi:MAG: aspartyl/asparaginyl beta-hydroxylase domain-containing protein [Rickettsiales bacterium]|nr:aspartyl/asparaginyl beta-hydroxylase domain-containing protein [Rickettsiales bacterium]
MKKLLKSTIFVLISITVFALLPQLIFVLAILLLFGICDVLRNRPINKKLLKKYFLGNGILTWILSPINLIIDLFCYKNKNMYCLDDYPTTHKEEIIHILSLFDNYKNKIAQQLNENLNQHKRSMLFFKWYGKNYNNLISEFNKEFRYIKTIGVSIFNPKQSTSWHFGPLRVNLRILYNLFPNPTKDAFITTQGKTHFWCDKAFFSFDDTMFHRSVNNSDKPRYCAFIDIERPSPFARLLKFINIVVGNIFRSIRGVFYKNWKLI